MQCVVRRYPALADGLHRVASPHTRHSLHRSGSRLLRSWSAADAAHACACTGRLASDSSDGWLLVSPTVGQGRLQVVPPHIISMVERCVGTGKDGLGKQLALLRRVNLGQRVLHLHSLVVIGRLGLDVTGV